MSEHWLPRVPAHSSLHPSRPVWVKAERMLASKLRSWTGFTGNVMRMDSQVKTPAGYYRIGNNLEKFVKIIPVDHSELQIQSDKMAAWLEGQNIAVSRLLMDFPKIINDEFSVLAYNYIDGRFSNKSASDIGALGLSLGRLHNAMKKCPYRKEVEIKGNTRCGLLVDRLVEIHKGHLNVHVPSAVNQLLSGTSSELLQILTNKAQVIHGDLNYGNILFSEPESIPVFLDFEDSWTAWFSPLMDLAFVIERFVLDSDNENTLALSTILLRSYYKNSDNSFEDPKQLGLILKGMSVRALLLLLLVADDNPGLVANSEWDKFIGLYETADLRAELLCEIATQ